MTRRRTASIAAAAVLLGGLLYLSLRTAPVPVATVIVTSGPLQATVDELGETRSHDRYTVAAPVAGRLRRIDLHDGDEVRAGQVLATLAPLPLTARERDELRARVASASAAERSAAAQLAHARADMEQARREAARIEQLHARGLASSQQLEQVRNASVTLADEVDAAQSRVDAATADLRGAQAGLAALGSESSPAAIVSIRAPVSGQVLRIPDPSERVVASGAPLMSIGDLGHLEVMLEMLSTAAVEVRPGMPVLLQGWGGERPLDGRVRRVEPYAFTKVSALGVEEKRTRVIVDFVAPPVGLGDGYRLTGRVVTWSGERVTRAPLGALFRCGQSWCAFAVEGNRARRREVRVGHLGADDAEVLGGVAIGDRLVSFPPNELQDGSRVRRSD